MKKTKLTSKQKLKTFCLSIIISFLFLTFLIFSSWWSSHFKSSNFFELVDKFILDSFFAFRNSRFENNPVFKESSSKIILVNIDDYSLDKIGRWPWRRDVFADFIERLESSHPKVIALDIIFADPDLYTSADYKLAKVFLKYDNIIFALLHYKDSAGKIQIRRPLKKQLTELSSTNKIKLIDQRLGFVGIDPDRDGVTRNTQLILPVIGSYPFYSWDILVSAKFLGIPLEKISSLPSNNEFILNNFSIPLNYGLMPINYVLPKIERPEKLEEQDYYKEFQPFWEDTISFYEVMQFSKEKLKKYFQNKLVLVGATALALEDIKSTPLGKMPGIYIHANIIGSILERNFLKTFKSLDNYLIILSLGMILGLILSQTNLILGVLALSALFLIYFFGNYYIFSHYNLLISIFPPLLNLFLVFSGIKIYH
ncbi:MAG: CHASE2 domain-containing protein [Armatimonadetes bacterium]|nr:CHASE2 domain-containing protein [Armatimonadota bacterium]